MEVEMGCSKTKTQNLPHNSKFSIKQILITQNDLAGILNHEKYPNKLGRIAPVIFWFADRFEK